MAEGGAGNSYERNPSTREIIVALIRRNLKQHRYDRNMSGAFAQLDNPIDFDNHPIVEALRARENAFTEDVGGMVMETVWSNDAGECDLRIARNTFHRSLRRITGTGVMSWNRIVMLMVVTSQLADNAFTNENLSRIGELVTWLADYFCSNHIDAWIQATGFGWSELIPSAGDPRGEFQRSPSLGRRMSPKTPKAPPKDAPLTPIGQSGEPPLGSSSPVHGGAPQRQFGSPPRLLGMSAEGQDNEMVPSMGGFRTPPSYHDYGGARPRPPPVLRERRDEARARCLDQRAEEASLEDSFNFVRLGFDTPESGISEPSRSPLTGFNLPSRVRRRRANDGDVGLVPLDLDADSSCEGQKFQSPLARKKTGETGKGDSTSKKTGAKQTPKAKKSTSAKKPGKKSVPEKKEDEDSGADDSFSFSP